MKKLLCILCCLALLGSLTGCGTDSGLDDSAAMQNTDLQDAPASETAEPETDAVQYPCYALNMELSLGVGLDVIPVYLTETAQISFTNTSDAVWEKICLRDYAVCCIGDDRYTSVCYLEETEEGPRVKVTSVKYDYVHQGIRAVTDTKGTSLTVQVKETDASVVYVTLAEPLLPGQQTTVTVCYETMIPYGLERLGWYTTDGEDADGLSINLSQAYPVLAEYLDDGWNEAPYFSIGECFSAPCGDFEANLTLPAGFTVISTGEEQHEADGSWHLRARNVRDFAIVAGNTYEALTVRSQGIPVRSWYYADVPESLEMARLSLQAAVDAVAAFTEIWGEYPYNELDVVETTFRYGGMEYPGLVRISNRERSLIEDPAVKDTVRLTVAHETAHQWFYAAVGNDCYREAWLDESFAAYAELAYLEYLGEDEISLDERVAAMDRELPEQYINLPYSAYEDDSNYTQAMYCSGCAFLWKLRMAMGKEAFDAFLRQWYLDNRFAQATTAQFCAAVEVAVGENSRVRALMQEYLTP